MRNLPLNSIRPFVNNGQILRIAGTLLAALIICSCEEYPEPNARTGGLFPRAAPIGWWHDEGASGNPRIVVHIGEQKAYFYKGKTLVGETTVSTGKPGFGTPPGHYTVLTKSADHVSSLFGDYVDGYGNVVSDVLQRRLRNASGLRPAIRRVPRLHPFAGTNREKFFRECSRRNSGHCNRVVDDRFDSDQSNR